jgi:putative transposase
VVLENHLHLIASAPDLPGAWKSFKRYTARQSVDVLERPGAEVPLRQRRGLKLPHQTASDYQVWQEGSQPRQIQGEAMLR